LQFAPVVSWRKCSLVIDPFRLLLISFTGWLNQRQQDVIDYLQEENRVLREHLEGWRLHFNDKSTDAWRSRGSNEGFLSGYEPGGRQMKVRRTLYPWNESSSGWAAPEVRQNRCTELGQFAQFRPTQALVFLSSTLFRLCA
jgi:hypothetical protein